MLKLKKFAIQDKNGDYLWGITSRSGVGFEHEDMPQFWKMNERTKLFDSKLAADDFAVRKNIALWTHWKVVPITVTYADA